jgi:hypothetical protein
MNLKKVLVAFMCVTALASFFGPTLTKVDATATVVDFETYSWSPPVLLGTGSFSDSGYTFAFHDGIRMRFMRTQHRETASISEMAQPPRHRP